MMYHVPVMLRECIDGLNIRSNSIMVDATMGGAGHSEAILEAHPTVHLFAFDQDPDAIKYATKRLERFGDRVTIIQSNFVNLRSELAYHEINRVDGILFDLGVSSHQIDESSRGFSFSQDSPLDMRMDQAGDLTAKQILNEYDLNALTKVLRDYGEEKAARKIAFLIVNQRKVKEFNTSTDLNDLITSNFKMNPKFLTKTLSRVYQALRIEVNGEMTVLANVLKDALNILNPGGRLVIESYHSLEDKIVKDFMKFESLECTCPPSFPICNCGKKTTLKILTRKPIIADSDELTANSRARSAKLRIVEKL
ncbi:MAG: 16S rRNA (cytosine(1402)-N(4))-methyltransferase RsmH [Candidatus Cloacimonadales bacterium]